MNTVNRLYSTILVVGDGALKNYFCSHTAASLAVKEIHMADNGKLGLSLLASLAQPPELLFLNVFMPYLDGIEFAGELAKRTYRGGLILVDDVDRGILDLARTYADALGLNVLGAFTSLELQTKSWGTA